MLEACLGKTQNIERGNYAHLNTSHYIIVSFSANWLHYQNQVQVGRSLNYYRKAPLWRGIVKLTVCPSIHRPACWLLPSNASKAFYIHNYMCHCRLSQQSCTSCPGAKMNLKWILVNLPVWTQTILWQGGVRSSWWTPDIVTILRSPAKVTTCTCMQNY